MHRLHLTLVLALFLGPAACHTPNSKEECSRERTEIKLLIKELGTLDQQIVSGEEDLGELRKRRLLLVKEIMELAEIDRIENPGGGLVVWRWVDVAGPGIGITPPGQPVRFGTGESGDDPPVGTVRFRVGPKPFVVNAPLEFKASWKIRVDRISQDRTMYEWVYQHGFSVDDIGEETEEPLPGEPRECVEGWAEIPGIYLARLYWRGQLWSRQLFELTAPPTR